MGVSTCSQVRRKYRRNQSMHSAGRNVKNRRRRAKQRGGFWGALFGTVARVGGRVAIKSGMRAAARAGMRAATRLATKQALKTAARTAGRKALSYGKKMAMKQVRKLPEHAARATLNYAQQKMQERRDAVRSKLRRRGQRGGFASFRSLGLGRTDLTDVDMRPWDRQALTRAKKRRRNK